jgi:hypothetical protein
LAWHAHNPNSITGEDEQKQPALLPTDGKRYQQGSIVILVYAQQP